MEINQNLEKKLFITSSKLILVGIEYERLQSSDKRPSVAVAQEQQQNEVAEENMVMTTTALYSLEIKCKLMQKEIDRQKAQINEMILQHQKNIDALHEKYQ